MLVKGHPFFTESPFCMKHIIDIDARAAALASVQSISVVTEYQELTKLRKKP